MALHNARLEAAAVIRHALSDRLVTLDYCRRWCADNKDKALKAIDLAAARIDDLRAWDLLPVAEFRPAVPAALVPEIEESLKFLTGTARDLRVCRIPHIAKDYDKVVALIERLTGVSAGKAPTPPR